MMFYLQLYIVSYNYICNYIVYDIHVSQTNTKYKEMFLSVQSSRKMYDK